MVAGEAAAEGSGVDDLAVSMASSNRSDNSVQDTADDSTDAEEADAVKTDEIAVHICGAVNKPGVYFFTSGDRLNEGIKQAGGFREDAAEDYLNLASLMEDGMQVVVPTLEEAASLKEEHQTGTENVSQSEDDGLVDLNSADEKLLCTLPGIGESKAKSIISYREEHGPFETIEQIMQVDGIKEGAFSKLKAYVTVR
jgi:competence protein ComEA